ncbi:MAG: hypothetical protein VX563_05760, partial [Planctomycetota bacterium]|nr:hypothetical protein [Planctomycetota bacterium]
MPVDVGSFNTILEFSTEVGGGRRGPKAASAAAARVARGRLLASMSRYGVRPDAATLSHVCALLMGDDMLRSAEAVRRAAYRRGVGLTERGWSSLAEGFARRGNERRALQLIGEMRARAVQPSRRTLEVEAACRIVQGRPPGDLARGGGSWRVAADILRHRMVVLCLGGRPAAALELHAECLRLGLGVSAATRQVLVQSLARHGGAAEMLAEFSELRRSSRTAPSLATYTSVVSRLSKARGRGGTVRDALDRAEALWREAREAHAGALDTAFFNSGLYVHARRGDVVALESLLRAMGSGGVRRDDLTHHCMIICYANGGAPRRLTKVLRQMESSGCRPGGRTFDLLVAA